MNNYVRIYTPNKYTEFQLVRRSEVPTGSEFVGDPKFGYFLLPSTNKTNRPSIQRTPSPFIPKPTIRPGLHHNYWEYQFAQEHHFKLSSRRPAKVHAHRVTRRKVRQALHNGEEEVYFQLGYTSGEFC